MTGDNSEAYEIQPLANNISDMLHFLCVRVCVGIIAAERIDIQRYIQQYISNTAASSILHLRSRSSAAAGDDVILTFDPATAR